MKLSAILALTIVALLFASTQSAEARGVPYKFGHMTVTEVAKMPDTDAFKRDGKHYDLGWSQKEWSLVWMPFWRADDKGYVLYNQTGDTISYVPVDSQEARRLAAEVDVTLPDRMDEPVYMKTWGWAILLMFIGYIVYSVRKDEKKQAEA